MAKRQSSKAVTKVQDETDLFINNELKKQKVVIFSKSTCKFSAKAKRILNNLKYEYHAVEVDELNDLGPAVVQKLGYKTGMFTVPNIFIGGRHLGGCEEIEKLNACGVLEEVLDGKLDLNVRFDFDVVVIGGGSAGLSTALACSKFGMKVCIVDFVKPTPSGVSWGIGGTCVNVGCVPKKLLHRAAILGSDLQEASIYGWTIPDDLEIEHDWGKLVETVQEYIESLNWKIRKDLLAGGVVYLNGIATLETNHNVIVKFADDNTKSLLTRNVVLAVGGRPRYLEFPGAMDCITSDDVFSLKEHPGRTLIVGGSYVALEIASFLNSLKAEVTVVVRSEILNSIIFDRDSVQSLEIEMQREGVNFIKNCTIYKVSKESSNSFRVDCMIDEANPYTDQFNTVVLAVGRIPGTDNLNLKDIGVLLCSNCKIAVNERDQTSVKNIFAVGDCANGRPELSSSAFAAGRLLAKRFNTRDCHCVVDYRCVPTSIFTWPEYACCGASEAAAIQLHGEASVKVYVASVTPLEQAVTEPSAKCTAKLITALDHNKVERLAGFHVVGPNASEIIQGFALALRMGASKKDLDCFIGIHPTVAEIFTNLTLKDEENAQRC